MANLLQKLFFVLMLFCAPSVFANGAEDGEWNYNDTDKSHGPSGWYHYYPVCAGAKQSPIDIVDSVVDNTLPRLQLKGYDQLPTKIMARHNGHTIQITTAGHDMVVSGGGLNGSYKFFQMHFHWGPDDSTGSEHYVNGRAFPFELHFVHWNTKYNNPKVAQEQPDGLMAMSVMVKVVSDNLKGVTLNPTLGRITDSFLNVHYYGNATMIKPFKFASLLPENQQYYRYFGSLTTPPCTESNIWTILKDPIYISKSEAHEFREFHEELHPEEIIDHSNRPLQPLNNRVVLLSQPFYPSAATNVQGSVILFSVLYALFTFRD